MEAAAGVKPRSPKGRAAARGLDARRRLQHAFMRAGDASPKTAQAEKNPLDSDQQLRAYYCSNSGASSPASMVSQSLAFKWAAQTDALHLGLAGAAISESGQSRRKVLVRLRCRARKTAQSYRKCSATKLSDDWAPPRDGESGETWDRQALGEPCIRHAQNASGRWVSAKPRQGAFD